MAGKDRANTGATLADVCVAFSAGHERGRVFPNTLPGHKLSKEAYSHESLLLHSMIGVIDNPHCVHISTACTIAKFARGRNVPPVMIAPEISRVPMALVLGMFAYIVATGHNLGTCCLTKEQFLVGRIHQ